jgi:hypothetical protein
MLHTKGNNDLRVGGRCARFLFASLQVPRLRAVSVSVSESREESTDLKNEKKGSRIAKGILPHNTYIQHVT